MLTSDPTPVVPVIDQSQAGHRKAKPKRDKVEQTLSQIRALHEVLNSQLYAYPNGKATDQQSCRCSQSIHSLHRQPGSRRVMGG